jgi:integrase
MIDRAPQAVRIFFNEFVAPKYAAKTAAVYAGRIAALERFLDRPPLLSDLNAETCGRFDVWLRDTDYADDTIRSIRKTIRLIWAFAHEFGFVDPQAPPPRAIGRPLRKRLEPRELPPIPEPTEPPPSNWAAIRVAVALQSAIAGVFGYGPDNTLGAFLARYVSSRTDIQATTRALLIRAQDDLNSFFGADRQLASFGPADADDFRRHMMSVVGENTAKRVCGRAKQFFTAAVRRGLIDKSPFADMKGVSVKANPARAFYVSRELTARVLAACPTPTWRLIFALARYGGLRCPSEHMALNWSDVDWDKSRLRVPSSKTAYCGKPFRIIPLFPELRPHLVESFELAGRPKDGLMIPEYRRARRTPAPAGCIEPYRPGLNLRSSFGDFTRKAGIPVWHKPFQNCRSTRETELANDFPIHVVCEWLGNTEAVARKHYLQMTDEYFDRAVGQEGGAT